MKNYLLLFLLVGLASCTKFLDTKPNQALAVPTTLSDLQAILDNYPKINNQDPGSGEVSADDYYLSDADWSGLGEPDRRLYTWEKDYVSYNYQNDWSMVYSTIYLSNVVLDKIGSIPRTAANQVDWDNVKGMALLIRARGFLTAVTLWSVAYDPSTAKSMPGIPLRMSEDFNQPSVRATVEQTYTQILIDLKESATRLPVTPIHVIRPSQPAAYALLARTYLAMGNYDSCALYVGKCLQSGPVLLDYNTLNPSAAYPISQFNAEVIMEDQTPTPPPVYFTRARIDSNLYNSYAANDLRKTIFFKNNGNGSYAFKGSYEGGGNLFSGIATDEVYLMRAEASAKTGNLQQALSDLNTLLQKRWKTGTFVPYANLSQSSLLQLIRVERRKELLMRGLRWMDIKRLNVEGAGIALTRIVNGQTYTLPAGDPRFAIAIPEEVIQLSGIQQNKR